MAFDCKKELNKKKIMENLMITYAAVAPNGERRIERYVTTSPIKFGHSRYTNELVVTSCPANIRVRDIDTITSTNVSELGLYHGA